AFGDEEERLIIPALEAARRDGMRVDGPLGADTLLQRTRCDAYVVMLHDQGHVAAKLLAPNRAAALTIGTPVLFSSVGHGAALDLAVHPDALRSMPRAVARFCHEFDLQLVQLLREAHGWHFVLAWSDDVGRPHFLVARVFSDFYVGPRRLLRSDELLRASPDVRFIHGLATTVESGDLAAVLTRLGILAGRVVQPPEALIAFVGPEPERRSTLMRQVARELAPAFPTGLATVEHGFHEQHDGVDLRVVLEAPEGFIRDHEDV